MGSAEQFKALMEQRKKENTSAENSLLAKNTQFSLIQEDFLKFDYEAFQEFTEDKDLLEYIKNKTFDLINAQAGGALYIGKNLTEVAEKLSKRGSPEGLYTRYLQYNGIKKDTALRLRKRWELYKKAKEEHSKKIISLLNVQEIEEVYRNQKLLEDFSNMKLEDVKDVLQRRIVASASTKRIDFPLEYHYSFLEKKYQKKISNLDEEKQKLALELLQKLEELLQ
ncbi:hypothetical protein [Fusobacterium necrophorum]|uniref:hypothetical protein n=1 Tax=Fusobacterium necrophorum TaxID=859 RepID=UPI0004868531|nr:hypothetical protein [Fusobacterium necrophorum]